MVRQMSHNRPGNLPPKSDVISLKDITVEESRGFTDGQLIEECKKRARFAYASQQQLNSDAGNLDIVYQEMVARFATRISKDNCGDKPTLKQGFIALTGSTMRPGNSTNATKHG